jgi:hypothetical protein
MNSNKSFLIISEGSEKKLRKMRMKTIFRHVIYLFLSSCFFLASDTFWHIIGACIFARNLSHLVKECIIYKNAKVAKFTENEDVLDIDLENLKLGFNLENITSVEKFKKHGIFIKISK